MIKKYWAYLLLGGSIVFFIYKKIEKTNNNFEVKTFKTSTGWGYDIYTKHKLFIHQDNIPAIGGNKCFTTKEDAQKVGNFVLHKMQSLQQDLPQITVEEIDSLQIKH